MKSANILGVRVDDVSQKNALKLIHEFIVSRKPHQIATVNPEFIMAAQKDNEFLNILNLSDLNVPDGAGINFVSKNILHTPINNRVPGIDLMLSICKFAEDKNYPVFLLGGEHGSGQKAAEVLLNSFPYLKIVGVNESKFKLFSNIKDDKYAYKITDLKPHAKDPNFKIINRNNIKLFSNLI